MSNKGKAPADHSHRGHHLCQGSRQTAASDGHLAQNTGNPEQDKVVSAGVGRTRLSYDRGWLRKEQILLMVRDRIRTHQRRRLIRRVRRLAAAWVGFVEEGQR
jgi:hypothetical protein